MGGQKRQLHERSWWRTDLGENSTQHTVVLQGVPVQTEAEEMEDGDKAYDEYAKQIITTGLSLKIPEEIQIIRSTHPHETQKQMAVMGGICTTALWKLVLP